MGLIQIILSHITEWWDERKEQEKHNEMMRRLYRNGEGRWDQKAYLKKLDEQKKKRRKVLRDKQEDAK